MDLIVKNNIRAELTSMFPCEFEAWRERGDDERHALSTAVMQFLDTPQGWQVNAEYRCEFGGLFPVQLRFTSPDEKFQLCLCSPGEVCPEWLVVLIAADGSIVRELLRSEKFAPDRYNALLSVAGNICRMAYSVRGVAAFLVEEVAS